MKSRRSWFRVLLAAVLLVPALSAAAASAPKKVLVVTVTTGFRHSCIPVSETILSQLAKDSGQFTVEFVRQPEGMPRPPARPRAGAKGEDDPAFKAALAKFAAEEKAFNAIWMPKVEEALKALSPENLKKYDALLFASTTGDLPVPDRQAVVDWVASGKAFIGVHAASDTFHNFPAFVAMLGGEFRTHGPQVPVECMNHDPKHAACRPVPAKWAVFDEIYQFKNFERARVHGLISLEKLMLNADQVKAKEGTPGDYPVAWTRQHGKGRVFYTSLGHREDMWDPNYTDKDGRKNSADNAKIFQQHLTGGILWALGLAPAK